MNENLAARHAAAHFICGIYGITQDRIESDKSGRLYVDYELMDHRMRSRVGVLTVIVLDCFGGETDIGISNVIADNPAYHADTLWVAKRLRNGEIMGVLEDFLSLRAAA